MKPKRVLITGINGFTGEFVAARLNRAGHTVLGLGSQPSYRGDVAGVTYQKADLVDPSALNAAIEILAPTDVIHLAALAFVAHGDPSEFYLVNVIGTRNLLAALRRTGLNLGRIVLASSANVYGVSKGGALSESTPAAPANDYAVSKLAMELVAKTFANDLPIIITRPFNYTGRGQSDNYLVAKCVAHFRRREAIIELGNIDVSRDFSDVRSLAEAYLGLIETAPIGTTVNICSGIPQTLRGIIAMAEEITGHTIEMRINPAFVRANEIPSLTGDPTLLHSLLPSFRSLPMRETLAWMLDRTPG
jgi:GDP-6-deoxy-D-talose 4-dehydrogenase